MNKKGEDILSMPASTIMWLIFAVFVLSSIGLFVGKMFAANAQANAVEKEDSIKNFDRIYERILDMTCCEKNFDSSYLPFSITGRWTITAFDKSPSPITSSCHNEQVSKPARCADRACICLWPDSNGDDFDGDSSNFPHNCYPLEGVDEIVTYSYSDATAPAELVNNLRGSTKGVSIRDEVWAHGYSNLVMYGECDGLFFSDTPLRAQRLYLDFAKTTDSSVLFISPQTEHTDKREEFMQEKYGINPLRRVIADLSDPKNAIVGEFYKNLARAYVEDEQDLDSLAVRIAQFMQGNDPSEWLRQNSQYTTFSFSVEQKKELITYLKEALPPQAEKEREFLESHE